MGSDEGITVEVVSAEILKREHYAENHEVVLKDEIHLIHETINGNEVFNIDLYAT